MAYVQLFTLNDEESKADSRLDGSAYLYAPNIWNQMSMKYLNEKLNMMDISKMKKVWELPDDHNVNFEDKCLILSTMDKVLIRKEELIRFKACLLKFENNILVNSMIKWIDENKNRPDFKYVGIHCNSISCEQWDCYSVNSMDDHFFLFDEKCLNL